MDNSTRIIDLTVNDLRSLITECVKEEVKNVNQTLEGDEIVFGMEALAEALGCSIPHAQYVKNTGLYAEAIGMEGRRVVTNKTLLKKLVWEKNKMKRVYRVRT